MRFYIWNPDFLKTSNQIKLNSQQRQRRCQRKERSEDIATVARLKPASSPAGRCNPIPETNPRVAPPAGAPDESQSAAAGLVNTPSTELADDIVEEPEPDRESGCDRCLSDHCLSVLCSVPRAQCPSAPCSRSLSLWLSVLCSLPCAHYPSLCSSPSVHLSVAVRCCSALLCFSLCVNLSVAALCSMMPSALFLTRQRALSRALVSN